MRFARNAAILLAVEYLPVDGACATSLSCTLLIIIDVTDAWCSWYGLWVVVRAVQLIGSSIAFSLAYGL
jgi:hypothetical protein